MGVHGLLSFMSANRDHFAAKEKLKDTKVVIEIQQLHYYLIKRTCYQRCSPNYRSDIYGGNPIKYSRTVKELFEALNKSGITPVIVAYLSSMGEQDDERIVEMKRKTYVEKAQEKLNIARRIEEKEPTMLGKTEILPQIFKTILRRIIGELGIEVIHVGYRGNNAIATLANDLKCPVMTNDSDLIMYPIERGFITIDDFIYRMKDPDDSLPAVVYYRSKLSNFFPNLPEECIPLLNAVLGKFALASGVFDKFIEELMKINGPYSGPLDCVTVPHKRIVHLLKWLSQQTSLQGSMDAIMKSVSPDSVDLAKLFLQCVHNYKVNQADDLGELLEGIYPDQRTVATDGDNPANGPISPARYLHRVLNLYFLTDAVTEIIFRRPHFDNYFLDDFSLHTSNLVKFRPYSLAMALLRPKSEVKMKESSNNPTEDGDVFVVYTRKGRTHDKFLITPLQQLENYGSLTHMDCYSFVKLTDDDKRRILMETFHFNREEYDQTVQSLLELFTHQGYCNEIATCLMLVKYSGIETKLVPQHEFVFALMITLLYFAERNEFLDPDVFRTDIRRSTMGQLKPHALMKNSVEYQYNQPSFRQIMHMIGSLQGTYTIYCGLNDLFERVCFVPRIENWFNGPLIFRLTRMMKLKRPSFDDICRDLPRAFVNKCHKFASMVQHNQAMSRISVANNRWANHHND